jgi:tetratricopeptide (TPR) repeat protein
MQAEIEATEIDATVLAGVEAHRAGQTDIAQKLYSTVLKFNPNHPDANHNLGLISKSQGKLTQAISLYEAAINQVPHSLQFWKSYIDLLVDLNRLEEVSDALSVATTSAVSHQILEYVTDSLYKAKYFRPFQGRDLSGEMEIYKRMIDKTSLGEVLKLAKRKEKTGDFFATAAIYKYILANYPNNKKVEQSLASFCDINARNVKFLVSPPDDFIKRAEENIDKNKNELAVTHIKSALASFPLCAALHMLHGSVLSRLGNTYEASSAFKTVVEIEPNHEEAWLSLGYITQNTDGGFMRAIDIYNKLLTLNPNHAFALNNLGTVYKHLNLLEKAQENFSKSIEIKPDFHIAQNNFANATRELGDWKKSIEHYELALKLKPDFYEAQNNLGVVYQELGRSELAIEAYERAVRLNKNYEQAYFNLVSMKPITSKNNLVKNMGSLYQSVKDKPGSYHICFALAKASEDLGEYEKSFDLYVQGNSKRKAALKYNISEDIILFDKLKTQALKLPNIAPLIGDQPDLVEPIFILGMPRSGTTLVEQILSSHTEIAGAGEQGFIEQRGTHFATGEVKLDEQGLLEFRRDYLAQLGKFSDGERYVTDKMPQNFRLIPLILAAFPEAKIIEVQRDPMATLWSNFKHCFTATGLGYSYNLDDLVEYHKLYKYLMSSYHEYFPNKIYTLNYEALTTNVKAEVENLISFLGVDFQESLMKPQDNKRRVATASLGQIRKKIYKGSSQDWQKFEPLLANYAEKVRIFSEN